MSIRLLWPFVKLAAPDKREVLVGRLQAQLGLSEEEWMDPDTRVPMQLAVSLLERWMEQLGQHDLGLLAAREVGIEHTGIVEYLARFKPTLGEALRSCDQYVHLLGEGVHQSLEARGERAYARLWFDGNLLASAAAYEFATAVRLDIARRITGKPALAPLEAHFMHRPPSDQRALWETFRCPLHFNMAVTQLVLPSEYLDLPVVSPEPVLSKILERHANALLAELPRTDNLVTRVRDMLNAEVELRDTNATRIALRLGMSVRSMARRLGEEGTSYRTLLDDRRKQAALRDLTQTLRPINDIAMQLGFASSQSFHRAFRRWTGETAAALRDRLRRRELAMH